MAEQSSFKFDIGDSVTVNLVNLTPTLWNKPGKVVGRYGRNDWIPRAHDTVVTTTPWLELMYTVLVDGSDSPTIVEESCLKPAATPA